MTSEERNIYYLGVSYYQLKKTKWFKFGDKRLYRWRVKKFVSAITNDLFKNKIPEQ